MKRKGLITLFGTICLMLILAALPFMAACAELAPPTLTPTPTPTPAPLPPAEPIVLKTVTFLPGFDVETEGFIMYMERVNERAKGELIIQYLGGPEVIPLVEHAMATRKGVIDMAWTVTGLYVGLVPAGWFPTLSRFSFAEERERGVTELLRQEHEKAGLFLLGHGWGGGRQDAMFHIWLHKKVDSPKDLAGMKIGGFTASSHTFIRALGASPVLLAFPDVFPAFDRGVIDGYWMGTLTVIAMGLYEITPYMIDHAFYSSNAVYIMNLDKWNRLPQHLQKLLLDVHHEVEAEWLPKKELLYPEAYQKMRDAGMEFIKFSPEDAEYYTNLAYEALWDELMEKYPDMTPKFRDIMAK